MAERGGVSVCAVAWECGTVCDVERRRVWAVGWNVERCVMWNDVECGLWDGMWNGVRCAVR